MSEVRTGSDNTGGMLYFIVGVLCIVVAIGGFLSFNGRMGVTQEAKVPNVTVDLPKVVRN